MLDEAGQIRRDVRFPVLAAHVWFSETGRPWHGGRREGSPVLGVHDGHAYALLYNGILGDRRPRGGNVLTLATLDAVRAEVARSHPDLPRRDAARPARGQGAKWEEAA